MSAADAHRAGWLSAWGYFASVLVLTGLGIGVAMALRPAFAFTVRDFLGLEKPRLAADLGDARFLILRNHGLLTVGASVAEAFLAMYTLENACRIQIDAQSGGSELIHVDPRILVGMAQVLKHVTADRGAQIAWPALLRRLDRELPGYAD